MLSLSRTLEHLNPTREVNWEAVYTEQLPRVYNYFRYRVGNDTIAEDLTATTFEKAWKHRGRYRRDLAAFSTWLLTLARNVAADHFRKPRREVSLETLRHQARDDSTEETVQRGDEFGRLYALLNQLSAREQELVALKYGGGLTNRDIAQLMRLSESNVGTILHRVVSKLRAKWEEKP